MVNFKCDFIKNIYEVISAINLKPKSELVYEEMTLV